MDSRNMAYGYPDISVLKNYRKRLKDFKSTVPLALDEPLSLKPDCVMGTLMFRPYKVLAQTGCRDWFDDLESAYYVLVWTFLAFERPGKPVPRGKLPQILEWFEEDPNMSGCLKQSFLCKRFEHKVNTGWCRGDFIRTLLYNIHLVFQARECDRLTMEIEAAKRQIEGNLRLQYGRNLDDNYNTGVYRTIVDHLSEAIEGIKPEDWFDKPEFEDNLDDLFENLPVPESAAPAVSSAMADPSSISSTDPIQPTRMAGTWTSFDPSTEITQTYMSASLPTVSTESTQPTAVVAPSNLSLSHSTQTAMHK